MTAVTCAKCVAAAVADATLAADAAVTDAAYKAAAIYVGARAAHRRGEHEEDG